MKILIKMFKCRILIKMFKLVHSIIFYQLVRAMPNRCQIRHNIMYTYIIDYLKVSVNKIISIQRTIMLDNFCIVNVNFLSVFAVKCEHILAFSQVVKHDTDNDNSRRRCIFKSDFTTQNIKSPLALSKCLLNSYTRRCMRKIISTLLSSLCP